MKVMIDIPKDFEKHFNQDKFKDSIGRITADVISQVYSDDSISGNYELELLEMLSEAFEKAKSIHSTCVLKGTPIYNDEPTLCVVPTKEIYKLRDKLYKLSNDKWDKWGSFERSGCDNKYLLGKAHAYSIVVDMIDNLLEDNLGGNINA